MRQHCADAAGRHRWQSPEYDVQHSPTSVRDPARAALTPKHRASHKQSKTCACNRGGVYLCRGSGPEAGQQASDGRCRTLGHKAHEKLVSAVVGSSERVEVVGLRREFDGQGAPGAALQADGGQGACDPSIAVGEPGWATRRRCGDRCRLSRRLPNPKARFTQIRCRTIGRRGCGRPTCRSSGDCRGCRW